MCLSALTFVLLNGGLLHHQFYFSARNCSGDGFSSLYYNKTDFYGNPKKIFFKYKYVEDMENDRMYNFNQVIFFLEN